MCSYVRTIVELFRRGWSAFMTLILPDLSKAADRAVILKIVVSVFPVKN